MIVWNRLNLLALFMSLCSTAYDVCICFHSRGMTDVSNIYRKSNIFCSSNELDFSKTNLQLLAFLQIVYADLSEI